MVLTRSNAEVINTALNQSVVFIKVADAGFTSNYWKVVLNFQLTPYEKAIETLRADWQR